MGSEWTRTKNVMTIPIESNIVTCTLVVGVGDQGQSTVIGVSDCVLFDRNRITTEVKRSHVETTDSFVLFWGMNRFNTDRPGVCVFSTELSMKQYVFADSDSELGPATHCSGIGISFIPLAGLHSTYATRWLQMADECNSLLTNTAAICVLLHMFNCYLVCPTVPQWSWF